jgi:hypothetical protein
MRSDPGCFMQAPFEGIRFRLPWDVLNEVCHDVGLAQVETCSSVDPGNTTHSSV